MWIIALVALVTAALTLFSGFGLGSLLLPAFALFFDLDVAVAATAIVHLLNNLFKAGMLGKYASPRIMLVFALPGAIAALAGAWVLFTLRDMAPLHAWQLGNHAFEVTPMGLTIGLLILFFAVFELHPRSKKLAVPPRYLPVGGALSGFLGGISGHQGALRATFMVRLGLSKEAFLGTSILCAVIIDIARIGYYATDYATKHQQLFDSWDLLLVGTLSAFLGSYLGRRMIEKVTMEGIRRLVGVMLLFLGLAVATGLVGSR
ncbi:MAG: sulfite exporter TauE/SafE family protein [Planctomycetota bacterium]|jgi:uncharacterized membrane protein YfcA